jgi:hypothetical protein
MKSSEIQLGHDYAVIPSWEYSSQDKKDALRVQKQHVAKAQLVSLTKYEYKVYRGETATDPEFVKAQQGSRTVGYLVKSDKWAGSGHTEIYWLARPQDIVALWGVLEPRWAEEERQEKEREKQLAIEQQKREEERKLAEEKRVRYESSTRDALRAIIGANRVTDKSVQFNLRYSESLGTVELTTDVFNLLLEKVLEAKDLVG